jgi:tetratricopeptide (TPR) repeat protein
MKDFFISYNKANKAWAEWIAWTLEESGYSVVIQAWDFRPGENFVLKMQEAAAGTRQTIAVLSEDYLKAEYTHPEWAAAFARDPQGKQRVLIPIRVKECDPEGLLASIIYIDLVGHAEEEARKEIIEGLKKRAKPNEAPAFPVTGEEISMSSTERMMPHPVQYPGTPTNDPSDSPKPVIPWNVPTGVPFFTGREDVLTRLQNALKASGATALAQRQAISGLGGIGKTQTAIEYALRHRNEYKAVLWAVAESRESLISDFVALAGVLDLPEKNVPDQTITVRAVKRWFETNADWLLILDNADDPRIVEEFLPETSKGHLLLTSRAQVFDNLGILNPVELEEMTPEDAKAFLLKRTGRPELEPDEAQAVEQLARELDYLPLALEQAGAYIKELRGRFQNYLLSYRQRGLDLLEKGHPLGNYPKSVRTTWSLNFQQVEQTSSASADLLRVSAFLNPDRIPSELFRSGGTELGPELSAKLSNAQDDPLALDEVLLPLIRYSLIHRDRKSETYDIHRLVQVVLKDGLDERTQHLWAERLVKAMARVFPDVDAIEISQWHMIERLLPHAQACAELVVNHGLEIPEAAQLLNLTGRYVHLRGRLRETEPLYDKSLAIREKVLASDHPDLATSLHNQGWLYLNQGKYAKAEPLILRSLAIREAALKTEHPRIVNSLDMLSALYTEQGRFIEAERLVRRSLEIMEKVPNSDQTDTANSLSRLVKIYILQDKYIEAESLLRQSLKIREKSYGPDHHEVAADLNNFALIHSVKGNIVEAEELYIRAITIWEKTFGINYPKLGAALENLAELYINQGRYSEAEPLLIRALNIKEMGLGAEHPDVAFSLSSFAHLYLSQERHLEAERLYSRSIAIREKSLGPDHPDVAHSLINLGDLYLAQRKYSKGEPLLRRAIPILRRVYGIEHSYVVNAMFTHVALLKGMNRKDVAQRLEAQAWKIQAKLNKKKSKR